MERGFQSLLLTGKYGLGDANFPPIVTSDETYIHREMSYQRRSYEKSVLSSLHYPYGSSISYDIDGNIQNANVCESFKEYKWRCFEREEKLKRLKSEPSTESFNFSPTTVFSQLPELQSLEQVNQEEKRFKQKFSPLAPSANLHNLESTLTDLQLATNYFTPPPMQPPRPPLPSPAKLSPREIGIRRRRTLSDKARSLQTLLPVDRKMDMATIYEETYKYIKFLKAQISALESMPVSSTSTSASNFRSENPRYGNMYGGLGKLNRQQVLELLVNSPAAQSILYSKGCCIYSLEQLMLFNEIAEKSFFSDPCMFS